MTWYQLCVKQSDLLGIIHMHFYRNHRKFFITMNTLVSNAT